MASNTSSDIRPATVALLGRTGVGKTSLVRSLVGNDFEPTYATHGVSEHAPGLVRDSSIIDIPEDFSPEQLTAQLAGRDLAVAIVLVDAGDTELSGEVVKRSAAIDAISLNPPPIRFLVISRSDLSLKPSSGLLSDLAHRYRFHSWLATSAKDGTGIQELRTVVLDAVDARVARGGLEDDVIRVVRTMTDALCELIAASPDALDHIEWRELERVIARALQKIGFDVELTPSAKDGGKDVVARCVAHGDRMAFYIEIKHWRADRPGLRHIADFIEVNATDRTDGGLFLSSSDFAQNVHGRLAEVCAQNVRLGQREKIVHLCRQFVKRATGVWRPTSPLPVLLFEETLE